MEPVYIHQCQRALFVRQNLIFSLILFWELVLVTSSVLAVLCQGTSFATDREQMSSTVN